MASGPVAVGDAHAHNGTGIEPRTVLVRAVRSRHAATAGAAILYALLAVKVTWPLAKDLDSTIFGAFGDLTGSMAVVREIMEQGQLPFAPGRIEDFAAPDGRPIDWPQHVASFSSTSLLYILAALFGPVAAFGLFVLIGFTATGTSMFLLVRRITSNGWIALLIGWAFAFYPFMVIKAAGHVHFVHGWVLVLVLWRMLVVYEAPTVRNGVLAGGCTVIALAWSPYFLLIGGIEFVTLMLFGLGYAWFRQRSRFREHLRSHLVAGAIVAAFGAFLIGIASFSERGTGVAPRGIDELTAFSARPLEYVVPPAGNAVVGDETGPWLADRLHGSNFAESTLYVGLSMLLLALVAVVSAVRRRLPDGMTLAAAAAVPMGLVALLWSAPPKVTILGQVFPFPALLTYELSGAWRVYTRFAMVVMLAVCVLAAIGLFRVLRGRTAPVQALLLVAVAAVVYVDLNVPGVGTNRIASTPVLDRLAELPDGLVASYPLEPSGHGDYSAEFIQQWHDKPIVNGYDEGSMAETRALKLDDLEDPRTAGRLATLGVRYVLIEDVPIEAGVQDPGEPGRGFRLIAEEGAMSLWRVTARPLPLLTLGPGFAATETPAEGPPFRWLTESSGEIELRGPCEVCTGTLSFEAYSLARPREIRLLAPDGRVVGRARLGTSRRRVAFPVRFRGVVTYRLETSPGPQPANEVVPGSTDERSLSVAVSRERLRLR